MSETDNAELELEPSTPRRTVLVAEDNAVNQLVARGMLEGLGYVVEFTQNGFEAAVAVSEFPGRFVAVLMDLRMPVLDGFAATRAIRQQERPGDRVPIIAVTASAMVGERERCLEAGMDDFLVKPVSFELLESTLDHWITGSPATAPLAPGTGDLGVLDLARIAMLQELRSADRSLFEQFVAAFLERVPADVEGIEAAIRGADHARLTYLAHGLKGSAQNLGATEVGRVCQELERVGELKETEAAESLLPVLARHVELASRALNAAVKRASVANPDAG